MGVTAESNEAGRNVRPPLAPGGSRFNLVLSNGLTGSNRSGLFFLLESEPRPLGSGPKRSDK